MNHCLTQFTLFLILQQISETPLIKEKYGESSKRSSTSLESKSMLSLVKMFMKLKEEGFDIRPTRKDKVIENVKMDRQVSFQCNIRKDINCR